MAKDKEPNLKEVADIEEEYEKVEGGLKGQDENKYYHNVHENEKDENGKSEINIKGVLQNAEEQIFSEFISANSDIEAKSKSELTGEALAKYEEFLKSERVGEIYSETDEKIKDINKNRNGNLKSIGERVDDLRIAVDNKLKSTNEEIEKIEKGAQEEIARLKAEKENEISAKEAEINALNPKDPDYSEAIAKLNGEKDALSEELSELSKDIAENSEYEKLLKGNSEYGNLIEDRKKLQEIRNKIGPSSDERKALAEEQGKKESEVDYGLSKDLRESLSNQKHLREKAKEKAKEVFGEDRVKDDFGITHETKDEKNKDGETLEGNNTEPKQQGQTRGGASQPQTQPQAQAQARATVDKTLEDMIEETKNSLPLVYKIGYDEKNAMNFDSATALLGNFANKYNLNDQERLEMLNDPESKKVLLKALKVAGDNLSPRKAKLFDDVREKIIDMSNGSLKQKALETIGITDPKDIKYEFDKANKDYNEQKNNLSEILESKHSPAEEKEEAKNKLEELNKKYESIRNVADFSKSVGHIKTIKSRLKGFTKALTSSKSTYKNLYESFKRKVGNAFKSTKNWLNEPSKDNDTDNKEVRYEEVKEEKVPETKETPETSFNESLRNSTYSEKEKEENTKKREEQEQAEKKLTRTQKNQKLYEEINKDDIDGPII